MEHRSINLTILLIILRQGIQKKKLQKLPNFKEIAVQQNSPTRNLTHEKKQILQHRSSKKN
jgi:hypothetical protein